ncbi:MAG: NAD(P)/FAD-dependent oxidoreductase [Promethearchaeota archaeon]
MAYSKLYDIAIIGAGCVGTAIAQRLSKFNLNTILIEKESDVSMGATKANSGIIHQGYFTTSGSLKEKLCLRGNELFDEICPKISVDYERIGAIFCATNNRELETLKSEFSKSKKRGVEVELIMDIKLIHEIEPQLNENVIAILHFPRAGIIIPFELTIALAEHAIMNGVELCLEFEVGFIKNDENSGIFTIHSTDGRKIQARTIVNAAGIYSDRIARMVGLEEFIIVPRRGEYILFDKDALPLKKIIFPTPTPVSKGIVISKTVHGNFFIGPNAREIESKEGINTTSMGLNEILTGALKIIKNLPLKKNITNFAGIRASTHQHDFIVEESKVPQFINVAGIDSPGLSSSLAIAEYVEQILREKCKYNFKENQDYIATREKQVRLTDLSEKELAVKIKKNPEWGQIICRCEQVTEAEIVEACKGPIQIKNTDMIKRRLRPGMGRCQGGFCLPKVMKIISREQGMILEQVTKTGGKSFIVFNRTKHLGSEVIEKGDLL